MRRARSVAGRGPSSLLRWLGPAGAVVLVVVLVANAGYLTGAVVGDPALQQSGLGTVTTHALLPGLDNIDPNIGFTAQSYGHLAALDLLHGHIPWWNPYAGVGQPLAGEMQGAALFPPTLLDAFANGQAWFRVVLEAVAGLSTLQLLRRMGCWEWAAAAGACAFAVNGTFSWLFHAPGNPVAFLPMALLGVERVLARVEEQRSGGYGLLAVALALSLYAGFPEVAFIDGLLVGLWVLVRLATASAARRQSLARIALGAAAGVALAAPILVAFVTYLPHADVGGHSGAFATGSLPRQAYLPAVSFPYIFGPVFAFYSNDRTNTLLGFWGNVGGYLPSGLVVMAMIGVLGAVGGRLRALRLALAAWVFVCEARTVGVHWATRLIDAVPGVDYTAFYRYFDPSAEMAVVVLAALGLDDLVRAGRGSAARWSRARVAVATGVAAVLAVDVVVRARPLLHQLVTAPHHDAYAYASVAWGVGVVALVAVAAVGPRRFGPAIVSIVLVVDASALFALPQLSAPRAGTVDTAATGWLARHVGMDRVAVVDPLGIAGGPLQPDYGSYFAIPEINVNDLPVPNDFARYVHRSLDPYADPLNFTGAYEPVPGGSPPQAFDRYFAGYEAIGVRYVLTTAPSPVPTHDGKPLPVVYRDSVATIAELPDPAPYFRVPSGTCTVAATDRTRATVRCSRPSVLVRDELWMPGWSATVGGRDAAVSQSGGLFEQVRVPTGTSVVRFSFTPPYEGWAALAALLGLAVVVAPRLVRRYLFSGPALALR